MDRRAEFMHQFAERYIAWRRETRERNPELPELTPLMALTSVLSVTAVNALKARRDGVESVDELADELAELSVWFSRAGEAPDSRSIAQAINRFSPQNSFFSYADYRYEDVP